MASNGISHRRLDGKVALVTGGASGIGESMVRLFCQHGAKVLIADVQDDLGQKLSQDLGKSTSFIHCDVSDESNVENAVDTAVALYGKLDIMVNNAGIVGTPIPSILDTKKTDLERVLGTNVVGTFLGIKHAARVMIPNGSGVIISTGSVCSTTGGAGPYAYTTSKHAILGLTRNAAVELGQHGIRVNCVSPTTVLTPMLKKNVNIEDDEGCHKLCAALNVSLLRPEDVAEAALFLASNESRFVNGHNLMVDGGYSIENRAFSLYYSSGQKILDGSN